MKHILFAFFIFVNLFLFSCKEDPIDDGKVLLPLRDCNRWTYQSSEGEELTLVCSGIKGSPNTFYLRMNNANGCDTRYLDNNNLWQYFKDTLRIVDFPDQPSWPRDKYFLKYKPLRIDNRQYVFEIRWRIHCNYEVAFVYTCAYLYFEPGIGIIKFENFSMLDSLNGQDKYYPISTVYELKDYILN